MQDKCQAHGLIVRAIRRRIGICPPMIITAAEIQDMCGRFKAGLDAAWAVLREKAALAAE